MEQNSNLQTTEIDLPLTPEVISQQLWNRLGGHGYLEGYKPVEELIQPPFPTPEFFIARPKEVLLPEYVGFKIHIPLRWDDKDFFQMVDKIASICQIPNDDNLRTIFKIGNPNKFAPLNRSGHPPISFNKMAAVYPNLRKFEADFSQANFFEMVRLAGELSSGLKAYQETLGSRKIITDLELRPNAWIRFGSYGSARIGGDEENYFWNTFSEINAPHDQKMTAIEDFHRMGVKAPENWVDSSMQFKMEQFEKV